MRKFLTLIITIFTFNCLFSNTISFSSAEINAGESAVIDISLDNESDVIGGIQFQIVDWPNYGNIVDVQTTDRTSAFTVSFNEQPDGSVIVVGFDLSAQGIAPGNGSILSLEYQSTGIYSSEIELSLNEDKSTE